MEAFKLEKISEEITRIELAGLQGRGEILEASTNVYLLQGATRALINAGHPDQAESLIAALREMEISPAEIERIIATSWEISVIGGASQFPRADLFVLSPDMVAPRDLEAQIARKRQGLMKTAKGLAKIDPELSLERVEEDLNAYYPRVSRDLHFIPLRNGHFVIAGALNLEVIATAGPGLGHIALYAAEKGMLFSGDFALSGFPQQLENAQTYLLSMERLAELSAERVLPNRGRSFRRGKLTMGRAAMFVDNFLQSVPAALVEGPTVRALIERDLGRVPEAPLDLLFTHQVFQGLLDELVRTRTIAAAGAGVERRYGVDVEDHRKEVRR